MHQCSKLEKASVDAAHCWIKPSLWSLLGLSLVLVSYSTFSSDLHGRWINFPSAAILHYAGASPGATPALTNISHLFFGIGGSAQTWPRRRGYSELWWRKGETRGYVWLDAEPAGGNATWPESCPPYRVSADASAFGDRASASRIARVVSESYRAATANGTSGAAPDVRWLVMGDDDTVFFTENLVAVLGKYDHRRMYYVGGSSESVEQDVLHSYGMAFGGGGFAVSVPAAAEIAMNMEGCLRRYSEFYGSDQRIHACMAEIGVPLTREPGFHQMDLKGDLYGFLAAHPVAPLVTLHHLDYVESIFPGTSPLESVGKLVGASWIDQARALQQTICYEPARRWSVSVSWGYTAQLYPRAVSPKDLETPLRTFRTWRTAQDGPFTFNTRPWGEEEDPCRGPLVYFLAAAGVGAAADENATTGRGTVTEYERGVVAGKGGERKCDGDVGFAAAAKVEVVRVTAPVMNPNEWKKAPRRQCCEARLSGEGKTMEVQIRKCRARETFSPP